MSLSDPARVTEILEQVAKDEILPKFKALQDAEVQRKNSGELVTVADVAAERAISRELTALLPGSQVVGEEGVEADPRMLEALREDAPVWLIDPIDGTGNFANGRPVFAVMVALVRAGETQAAWILDPISGDTAIAERGAGAFMAGRRLKVQPASTPEAMQGTLHAGQFASPSMHRHIKTRRDRLNTLRTMSCAGAEYIRLVTGEMQFSFFTKMKPWDHAPGGLIHWEAGGVGMTLDRQPYAPAKTHRPGLLLAPDQASWDYLFQTLFGDTELGSLAE
ncbi:MAG: inositol monophosphatase [Pseudomonadota bacterium]